MELHEPVPIYTVNDPATAEILRVMLEQEGIRCEIEGAHQGGLAGVLSIRLLVPATEAQRAREFLDAHESTSPH